MSYITTVKQGPTGIFIREGTKNIQVSFASGEKFITDAVSSQMERLAATGIATTRKATVSEQTKYKKYIVDTDTGGDV